MQSQSLGQRAQILAFFSVKTESGFYYILIIAASRAAESKSSVIILDSELKIKTPPGLDGLFVSQVAERLYEGHLFAINKENNLIAMNLKRNT